MRVSKPSILKAALIVAIVAVTGCAPEQRPIASQAKSQPQSTAPAIPQSPATTVSPGGSGPGGSGVGVPGQTNSATDSQRQELMRAVELAYQNGVSQYHAGKLQAAKENFDHAVDLMLTSKFDLKSDPALSGEFDRVVDAVNALEMEALKQGNGFAPKIEPAPVDIANDVTFPVDPNIKAQAIAELKTTQSDLPLLINDPVAGYIAYFSTRGRGTLMRSLERAGRYRDMISRVLAQEGVPQDLIYQAVAESGFQPQIVNARSGAGGMWQFMPSGPYGLERNGWFDERFDPEKSTVAYARYMKDLYAQLGDWYLAMAAYDWGPGNVQRSVQRTGYADFWELYRRDVLPRETKNYVPIIIAAAIMAKNPQQYGLEIDPDPPLMTDTVTTNHKVDLRLVADVVEAPIQEIIALNPSLLRMSTPGDAPFDLHLPPGTKELYEKRIAEIPQDKRDFWRFHKTAPGETLASLAHDYHVSASEIAFVNQLRPNDELSTTDSLIIPVAPAPSIRNAARLTQYRVEHGDTLVTVADRFNVTVQQLRRWNHLNSNQLEPGRDLYVAEPAHISRFRRSRKGGKSRQGTHNSSVSLRNSPSHGSTSQSAASRGSATRTRASVSTPEGP